MSKKYCIGAAIMASGWGERFGGNKLMADAAGICVAERTLQMIAGCEELFGNSKNKHKQIAVVTRYLEVAELAEKYGFRPVLHDNPDKSDTVRLGTQALQDCDGIMFIQADQFLLRKESIRRMIETFQDQSAQDTDTAAEAEAANAVLPVRLSFEGTPGSPVIFPADYYEGLMSLTGDIGGASLLKGKDVRYVEAECGYELWDVDKKDDLEKMVDILGKIADCRSPKTRIL